MKHLKKLVPVLVVSLLLSACAKENETMPRGGEYLVSEVWVGDLLQSSWSYDELDRLSSLLMYEDKMVISKTDYSYDDRGNLIEASTSHNNSKDEWVERFEYDGDGKLVRATTDVDGVRHLNHIYRYDGNKVTQISQSPEGFTTSITQVHDQKGNRIEIAVENGSYWSKSVFGDFDDKRTFSYASDLIKSVNNPRYEKVTSSTGSVQEFIYRYTYNDAGYVTSSEKMDKASNGTVEKVTYKLIHKN
jgi:YD repeat-containing protein